MPGAASRSELPGLRQDSKRRQAPCAAQKHAKHSLANKPTHFPGAGDAPPACLCRPADPL